VELTHHRHIRKSQTPFILMLQSMRSPWREAPIHVCGRVAKGVIFYVELMGFAEMVQL